MQEGLHFLDVLEDLRAGGSLPEVPLSLRNGTIDPSQTQFRSEEQLQAPISAGRMLYLSAVETAPEGNTEPMSQCIAEARRDSQGSLPQRQPLRSTTGRRPRRSMGRNSGR